MADRTLTLALTEFLFSSDRSDDDIEIEAKIINFQLQKIPRINNYMKIVEKYNDYEFKYHFRISRETYYFLIEMFANNKHFPLGPGIGGLEPKTPAEHILCFLWFAGNKSVIRSVADLFNVSISTAHLMIQRVINFLNDLAPSIITFPRTVEEREKHDSKFEEICGIPGIVGCIDGSYIPIRTPSHKIRSTYVNRHDETAITLQGICNSENMFLDVFMGVSSKVHDVRVYRMSFIRETICQMGENYHIIGDSAYPLSINLITSYKDYGTLSATEKTFNTAFCRARVKIEYTFGILKNRFRQLLRLEMWSVLKISKFIMACCVLHNLCINKNDNMEFMEYEELYNDPDEYIQYPLQEREAGKRKRDTLAAKLINSVYRKNILKNIQI